MAKRIVVIGAGFGGLSAAAYLAKAGHQVTVLEKNKLPGGRAQVIKQKGFTFDAGPSWYMMPDVFEDFFADFGYKPTDFFKLTHLNPAYQVITNDKSFAVSSYPKVKKLVGELDPQAKDKFEKFYQQTKRAYHDIREDVLEQPMISSRELLKTSILRFLLSKDMLRSYHQRITSITKQEDLQHTLEFMSVFMGGSPKDIPGIYALLSYVDMGLGVFYPQKGFGELAKAFESVAKEQGVIFRYNVPVDRIITKDGQVVGVVCNGKTISVDAVVANADYQFVESKLLPSKDRSYSHEYWHKADVSPSSLLLFLGVNKKLTNLTHHNLFFDTNWNKHFADLKRNQWTEQPLFYMSAPSKTDPTVAPRASENLFVLAPMPAGKQANAKTVQAVTDNIIERIEKHIGSSIREHIVVQEVRAQDYFKTTFNAYQGNAFGLSHTLRQSAIFRPRMQSKKVSNLFYTGHYTNPGTGVPMVVLSGKTVANLVQSKQ